LGENSRKDVYGAELLTLEGKLGQERRRRCNVKLRRVSVTSYRGVAINRPNTYSECVSVALVI